MAYFRDGIDGDNSEYERERSRGETWKCKRILAPEGGIKEGHRACWMREKTTQRLANNLTSFVRHLGKRRDQCRAEHGAAFERTCHKDSARAVLRLSVYSSAVITLMALLWRWRGRQAKKSNIKNQWFPSELVTPKRRT